MALTIKQEAFATAYIENGGNASAAYRTAFDAENMTAEAIAVEACRLLQSPKVALRIAELKAALAKRHEITADTITRMLIEDRDFARELESAAAATTATMGLAKLHGLLVDKVKSDITGTLAITKIEREIVRPQNQDG